MKRNRNPRRAYHQKRECWVNRIPVMSTSSWRWLTNSVKPVKRRFTNSGIRGKHCRSQRRLENAKIYRELMDELRWSVL